jgi:SRSO17 transposase
VTAPARTAAQHQSLLHLVAQAPWSDAAVLRRVRERVMASLVRQEPIQAWIGGALTPRLESSHP